MNANPDGFKPPGVSLCALARYPSRMTTDGLDLTPAQQRARLIGQIDVYAEVGKWLKETAKQYQSLSLGGDLGDGDFERIAAREQQGLQFLTARIVQLSEWHDQAAEEVTAEIQLIDAQEDGLT